MWARQIRQYSPSRAFNANLEHYAWPDRLPTSSRAMKLTFADVKSGARYDPNSLALPAVLTGKRLLGAPEIVGSDLVRGGVLHVVPGSRTGSGMQYRAYAVDRSDNSENLSGFLRVARASLQKGRPPRSRVTSREQSRLLSSSKLSLSRPLLLGPRPAAAGDRRARAPAAPDSAW